MNYESFSASDFLADPRFRRWVLHRDRECTAFWESWLLQYPEKRDEINEAKAILYALRERAEVCDDQEIEKKITATLARIQSDGRRSGSRFTGLPDSRKHPVRKLRYWLSAASVVLLLAAGWFWTRQPEKQELMSSEIDGTPRTTVLAKSTATDEKRIVLEDGSTVTLAPGSELSYPAGFDSLYREVSLIGEAFF